MPAIKFDDVSKKYKLYSKGGLYLRDRITHALQRFNPFNGAQYPAHITQQSLEKDFWALKNVSFEVKPGESVGFIGRNGAGKSTILKLLAGVTKPSSGKVAVNGKVAALIEVGAGFHPELTGRENVFLNGSILGMKKTEIEKCFDSIVGFAELEEFIDTPVKHYSSGMYVRLGFAIAAHTNPDIFLIDEVLAVGDEAFQKKCLDTLAAHKANGKTMILVSHNLEKVAEVCDRCIYVNHGEISFDGPPSDATRRYKLDVEKSYVSVSPSLDGVMKQARILDVTFRAPDESVTVKARTGEDLIVEIQYETTQAIPNPIFGIAIHGSANEYITGFNTKMTEFGISSINNQGSVFCHMRQLPLNRGTYQLSAAIHDRAGNVYDYHSRRYILEVESSRSRCEGLVNVAIAWEIRQHCAVGSDKEPLSSQIL